MLKRRIGMSVIGVTVCAISVGIFKIAALGVDPFQSLMSGLNQFIPISFGTLYVIVNLLLLTYANIFVKKKSKIDSIWQLFKIISE